LFDSDKWGLIMLDSETKKKLIEQTREDRLRRKSLDRKNIGITEQKKTASELNECRDNLDEVVHQRTAELLRANEVLKLEDINLKKAMEALSESEEKFRTMFELSPYSTILPDLKGTILACNQPFLRLHATAEGPAAQVGRNVSEFFPKEEHSALFSSIEKKIAKRESRRPAEYTMLREDGAKFLAEARSTIVLDGHGKPQALLAIAQDITNRKRAEDALRESERRYETVVKNAGEGIVVAQDGVLQYANPYVEATFGRSREEMVSRLFIEFVHPDDRERVKDIYQRRLKGEQIPPFYEIRVIDKHGDTRWVENNGILIEWNGKPATLNFLRDITERKKTEDALRKSEQQYRRFYENAPLGYQSLDSSGNCLDVNKKWLNILGYSKAEVIGRCFADFVAPEFAESFENHFSRLRSTGRTRGAEFEMRAKDGSRVLVSFNGDIEYDQDGRFRRSHCVMQDITQQRKAEQALHESEEKYRQLFETETDAIVILDAETKKFIDVNDAAVHLYGYSREEFLCLTLVDISAEPEASETAIKHVTEGFPTRIPLRRHKKKDGAIFPVEISGSSFMLNGRKVVFGVMRDITDRKRAEEELEKQRYYLAKAQEMGRIGTWELDIRKNKLFWTEETYQIFGLDFETELTYEAFLDCVHPDDREYVDEKWQAALNNEPYYIEHRIIVDGKVKWVGEKADVQFDEEGRPVLAIGFAQDITNQKQAEEALRESEGFLQSVFDGIRDGISVLDCDLNIVRVNEWIEQMYGSEEQLVGRKCYQVYQRRESLCPWCPSIRAIETGEVHIETVPFPFAEDPAGWLELSAFPLKDTDGAVVGVVEHGKDITKRKRAEQEILENQTKLKSLASQLSRSEERERYRLATALHDQVGQSLVFSKLKLDELRATSPSCEVTDVLKEVCTSLANVIRETRMLTFDLSSPILYELGFEVAVAEWLADEIKGKHGIETEFCDDGREKPLDDDIRALLFRNVRELLVNVVKHAQAHKVKVDIRRAGADICISVEDDGIGFDPAEVKAMAVNSNKFGLFSIRERLEQLGGLIEIDSEHGRGSRVSMKAPLKCETLTDGIES